MKEETAFFFPGVTGQKKPGWSVSKQDVCTTSRLCFQTLEDTACDGGLWEITGQFRERTFLLAILRIPMQMCPFRWGKSKSVAENSSEKVAIPGRPGSLVWSSVRPVTPFLSIIPFILTHQMLYWKKPGKGPKKKKYLKKKIHYASTGINKLHCRATK